MNLRPYKQYYRCAHTESTQKMQMPANYFGEPMVLSKGHGYTILHTF